MPTIPDALWRESDRPLAAWLIRAAVALVPILIGWVLVNFVPAVGVYGWGLAVLGLALFFVVPSIADAALLAPFARRVDGVDRSKAHTLLDELRANKPIAALAPHGWMRLQEAKLYLAVDDHRAAAKAFAEAERVSTHAGPKRELISAQAHALTLAGDRKPARELLARLAKLDALTDLDHFNFGIVLLSESGHNKDALDHLLAARESFADHPRLLAALVLAHQRCDQGTEAAALLDQAEAAVEASGDQLAADLLKRGKKGLRPLLESKKKRERKADADKGTTTAAAKGKSEKAPKGKKGRKQARRDARKKAKADAKRSPEAEAALEQGGEAETTERDEALADAQAAGDERQADDGGDEDQREHERDVDDGEADDDEADDGEGDDGEADDGEAESDDDEADESDDDGEDEADDSDDDDSEGDDDDSDDDDSDDDDSEDEADESDAVEPQPRAPESQQPTEPQPAAEIAQPPETASDLVASQAEQPADDSDDLASLVRDAMSSSGPKLDDEPRASTSGIRPIEPASASPSLFRSALFSDEPKAEEKPKSSLFSMPSFGDLPTFAPPPMPSRGPLLPSKSSETQPSETKPSESSESKPAAPAVTAPPVSAPAVKAPAVKAPSISAPAIKAPSIGAPPIGAPSAPTPKPPAPALDDGWGDLPDAVAPAPVKPDDGGEGSP